MKIAVVFLAIIVLAFTLPAVIDALFDFRTDTVEEVFNVDTAVGVTNSSVQLAEDLWDGSIIHASISSNNTSEIPSANSYNVTTRNLLVTNLLANAPHILTVSYKSAGLTDYSGAEAGVKSVPTAIVAALIILPLVLLVGYFTKR